MSAPFIPAEQLQRIIVNQLFQSLKLGPNPGKPDVTGLQLQQLANPPSINIPPIPPI